MKGLESVALEIDAPPETEVFINGVALGQAYQTGEIPCPGLTELESRFETVPHYVRYRVDAMYGSVSVTDSQGRELAPEGESAEGLVRYVVPAEETYSFTVRAPEGVTVSVCGAQLDPAEAVSSRAGDPGGAGGLSERGGGVPYPDLYLLRPVHPAGDRRLGRRGQPAAAPAVPGWGFGVFSAPGRRPAAGTNGPG